MTIDGITRGVTPLEVELTARSEAQVHLERAGWQFPALKCGPERLRDRLRVVLAELFPALVEFFLKDLLRGRSAALLGLNLRRSSTSRKIRIPRS